MSTVNPRTSISNVLVLAEAQRDRIQQLCNNQGGETGKALHDAVFAQERFIRTLKEAKESTVEDLEARVKREMEEINGYNDLADHYVAAGLNTYQFSSVWSEQSPGFPKERILALARERSNALKTQILHTEEYPMWDDYFTAPDPLSRKVNEAYEMNQRFIWHLEGKKHVTTYGDLKRIGSREYLDRSNFLESLRSYKKQLHVTSGGASSQ